MIKVVETADVSRLRRDGPSWILRATGSPTGAEGYRRVGPVASIRVGWTGALLIRPARCICGGAWPLRFGSAVAEIPSVAVARLEQGRTR
jgi:hypothetical protein